MLAGAIQGDTIKTSATEASGSGRDGAMENVLQQGRLFFESIINAFGPVWTVLVALGIYGACFLWRLYNDRRKDRERDIVLEEKERSLQRLANEARAYRAYVFKEKLKCDDTWLEKFMIENDFRSGPESRRVLERQKNGKGEAKQEEGKGKRS